MKSIYMDHAATTPLDKRVFDVMHPYFDQVYGNPSSIHRFGREARKYLDNARRVIAESIHANEKEVIFTSGGTEADNLALIGTAVANQSKGNHIIITDQEHYAILDAAGYLEEIGFRVTYLPSYHDGKISMNDLIEALTDKTILVSVMTVNNETGVIQPIKQIGELLKNHQAYFHTDAVQAFGLLPINVKEWNIDLLTASAHKINGPKGIGFLYASKGVKLNPLQYGGEQEGKRRPGTENLISILGFQKAVELTIENREDRNKLYQQYKDLFLDSLKEHGVNFKLNGDYDSAISSIVNISFPNMNVETLLTNLDIEGVAASSGSACTAGSIQASHVLVAMYGHENDRTKNSIRFSFGLNNTREDVVEAARRIAKIVKRLTK